MASSRGPAQAISAVNPRLKAIPSQSALVAAFPDGAVEAAGDLMRFPFLKDVEISYHNCLGFVNENPGCASPLVLGGGETPPGALASSMVGAASRARREPGIAARGEACGLALAHTQVAAWHAVPEVWRRRVGHELGHAGRHAIGTAASPGGLPASTVADLLITQGRCMQCACGSRDRLERGRRKTCSYRAAGSVPGGPNAQRNATSIARTSPSPRPITWRPAAVPLRCS